MTKIELDVRINAPKERVWDTLANLGQVVNYHPYVTDSYYTSSQNEGMDAARVCEFGPNLAIEETAIAWNPGESYTLAIEFLKGTKPPITNILGTLAVRADGNASIVTMVMSYDVKFGLVGFAMDRMMVQPRYRNMINGIMVGLKHHVETGELVNKDVLKRIEVVPAAA